MPKNLIIGVLWVASVIWLINLITTFDNRRSEPMAQLTVLRAELAAITAEAEQIQALLRKVDGGQGTDDLALEATNQALDSALAERGFTTIDELRNHLSVLDSKYRGTLSAIRMQSNPKPNGTRSEP